MNSKPYNYKELEKKFPAQPQEVFFKRIERIADKLKSLGYEEVGERSDGRLHFEKKTGNPKGSCSFGLWQIEHETDEDFEHGFKKFFDSKKGENI